MDVQSNRTAAKHPPPISPTSPSSSASSSFARKSIIKISSPLPATATASVNLNLKNQSTSDCETMFNSFSNKRERSFVANGYATVGRGTSSNNRSTRVIPVVYRSISNNSNDNDSDDYGSLNNTSDSYRKASTSSTSTYQTQLNYKSPFNRINFTISSPDSSSLLARTQHRRLQYQQQRILDQSPYVNHRDYAYTPIPIVSSPAPSTVNDFCIPKYRTSYQQQQQETIKRTSSANPLYSDRRATAINGKRNSLEGETSTMGKDDVWKTLDQIEKRMTFFREIANELYDEKSKLMDALNRVECFSNNKTLSLSSETFTEADLQDIQATVELLSNRLNSIDIVIKPLNRSQSQIEAFQKANEYIDGLRKILANEDKLIHAKKKCLSYISSCSSDDLDLVPDDNKSSNVQQSVDNENHCNTFPKQKSKQNIKTASNFKPPAETPIDERFQKMVIECSLEDQKKIKKDLKALLEQIEKLNK